jgi:parvulin-like peptidyl-prolyl isomerase
MKKSLILSCAALALCWSLNSGLRAEDLVAKVDSEKIDAAEFQAKVAQQEKGMGRALSPDERKTLLNSLINQRLLVAEARDKGLDKKDEVRQAVADYERELLAKLLFQGNVKIQVSPEDSKKFYDSHPDLFELRKASQILIHPDSPKEDDESLKKAQALKAKLDSSPKSFAKLAKESSDDSVSGKRGGELGELRRGNMAPELEKAIFSAKVPSILGPVKTQFGYHILQVQSVRTQSYDEAKDAIAKDLAQAQSEEQQKALLDALRSKHKVSILKDKP